MDLIFLGNLDAVSGPFPFLENLELLLRFVFRTMTPVWEQLHYTVFASIIPRVRQS